MSFCSSIPSTSGSRPVWARGLKRIEMKTMEKGSRSRPVWARGLKRIQNTCLAIRKVAPRVGAWIETWKIDKYITDEGVAPRVGAWIETENSVHCFLFDLVAPRVGAWIETSSW